MSTKGSMSLEWSSKAMRLRLERACDGFEDRLRRGERPSIEDCLAEFPEEARPAVLFELLALEVTYRLQTHETPTPAEYVARFPSDVTLIQKVFSNSRTELKESTFPDDTSPRCPCEVIQVNPGGSALETVDGALVNDAIVPPPGEARDIRRSGNYIVQEQIGQGGLGSVFLAHDPSIGRRVAIKQIRADSRCSPELAVRFREEAQITGQLEHPNIVPIHELGDLPDGSPYYAMRLLGKQTLRDAIRKLHEGGTAVPGRVELDGLLRAFIGVCQALAYAHSRKVLHRDLKPVNIMLGDFGEVFVLDWGLAKVLDAVPLLPTPASGPESARNRIRLSGRSGDGLSSAGSVIGTPAYMSPEQAQGRIEEIDPRSDIFSLGAILYEFLVGRPPYEGKRGRDVLAKAQQGQFARPRQIDRRVSPALEAICLKAMALNPDDRYASAGELAADIARWQADEPVTAYPEPLHQRAARWAKKHRTLCMTGLAACAAFVIALVWWNRHEAGRIDQLRTASLPLLLEGQKRLAEDDVDGARLTLNLVQGKVADEPALADVHLRLGELFDDADKRRRRRAAIQADLQRLTQFNKEREKALAYLTLHAGLDLAQTLDKARQAAEAGLGLFGVSLDRFDAPILTSRHYSEAQREEIQRGSQELLLIGAAALAQPVPERAAQETKARAQRALELLKVPEVRSLAPQSCQLLTAKCLLLVGQAEPAAEAMQAARRLRPASAPDAFFAGLEAYFERALTDAKGGFQRALQMEPRHFWAQYFLAACHLHEVEEDQGAARQAIAHLSACLHAAPGFLWSYVLRGYAYGAAGDFASAEADFQKALSIDAKEYAIYVNRGEMRLKQQDLAGAEQDFIEARRLASKRFQAYLGLAGVRRFQQRRDEAKEFVDQAIGLAPGEASLYAMRAQLKLDDDNPKGALADFQAAAERSLPASLAKARLQMECGRILHRVRRFEDARKAYDAALARPELNDAFILRGLTLMELGKHTEARQDFDAFVNGRAASREAKQFVVAHRERGLLRATAGDSLGALEDYVQALALANPKELSDYDRDRLGFIRARRGWTLLLEGKHLAEADFDQALALNPNSADAYNGRAFARVLQARYEDGVRDAETALRVAKKDAAAYTAGLCTNAACVFAQAARFVLKDSARKDRDELEKAYRLRALELLQSGIGMVPPAERAGFARAVLADEALDPIRNSSEFQKLERSYSR